MDLMALAEENIPVRVLAEVMPYLKEFDSDSAFSILSHDVRPWLSNSNHEGHVLIAEIVEDFGGSLAKSYAYVTYDYSQVKGYSMLEVHIIPGYAFLGIARTLKGLH